MTDLDPTKVTSPGDLAEVVPFLLGFEPHDAMVAVFSRDGLVEVAAHMKLADLSPQGETETASRNLMARFAGCTVTLLAYTDNEQRGWNMIGRFAGQLPDDAIRNSLVINQDTWVDSYGERGKVDRYGVVSAHLTSKGLTRLASRDELEARFRCAPSTPDLLKAVTDTRTRVSAMSVTEQAQQLASLQWRHLSSTSTRHQQPPLGTSEAIELAILTQHNRQVSEVALVSITSDNAPQHRQLWHDVIAHVPQEAADAAWGLAGMAAWIDGDGASANIALERLKAAGPSTELGRLLNSISTYAVPPTAWEDARPQLTGTLPADVLEAAGMTILPPQVNPQPEPQITDERPQPAIGHDRDNNALDI